MLYQVQIRDLVPLDNFYRRLSAELNFEFLYKDTAPYYGNEGQQSIDPVVFFKICLVGYFNNINSDRRLMSYCSNCLDIRLFLRYDIDEELPWHSTISRTRQLYGEEVFLSLFQKILTMCVHKGMVKGKRQAIDSAFVKANASIESLLEKDVVEDAGHYVRELNEGSEFKIPNPNKTIVDSGNNTDKDSRDGHGNFIPQKNLSNATHYSPTDPDARISVKPGKARKLNYLGQISVDDANHVITGAMADFADKRDSQCLPALLTQTIENLYQNGILLEQITADTNYSSAESLRYCDKHNIDAYIPNFGPYKPLREGFEFNRFLNRYECTRGNKAVLPFDKIKTDSRGQQKKIYRNKSGQCKECPLRSSCIGKSDFKSIEENINKPLYDKMHKKLQTPYAKWIRRVRSKTVEPVLGTLGDFMSMKKVNYRGIKQANKHVMMAAACYNLKKYMKFISKKAKMGAASLNINLRKNALVTHIQYLGLMEGICALITVKTLKLETFS